MRSREPDETRAPELAPCQACQLVTLFELLHQGLVMGDTVDQLAQRLGEEVVTDDLERPAVSRVVARRLVDEKREWKVRVEEDRRRRIEEAAAKVRVKPKGLPTPPGTSPGTTALEVMMAYDRRWR